MVYRSVFVLVLIFVCELCVLNNSQSSKLQSCDKKFLRAVEAVEAERWERIINDDIRKGPDAEQLQMKIEKQQVIWQG